jgi:putative DNA primase/helicase
MTKRVVPIDGYERDGVRTISTRSRVNAGGEVFEANEDGIALAFAAKYQNQLLFDHTRGRWYVWKGDRWQVEETDLAFDFARKLVRDFRTKSPDKALTKIRLASEVERAARSDRRLVASHDDWDPDPLVLGVPGGAVDLKTGELLQPDPQMKVSRQAAVSPAPFGSPTPKWQSFLHETTGGDEELILFLQIWSGYCLTGSTSEQALSFVYGPGGNGKSVFINTLTGILGDYAVTAAMDTFTAKRFESHSTDIAALAGARLVVASETEEGKAWAEARLKQLTGGDTISARFMRQDNFSFRPRFKLTITGNYQPTLQSADPAMERRLNIVPFTQTPTAPDKGLEDKLRGEWPAILRWMIDGCLLWQEKGLVRPDAVCLATADYFADQDLFGQWLEECCQVDQGNEYMHETSGDLYQSYSVFVKGRGEYPLTSKAWAGQLKKRSFMAGNSRSKGGRYYEGIRLLRPNLPYSD